MSKKSAAAALPAAPSQAVIPRLASFCESKEPTAVAPASQIASPPAPIFRRFEIPTNHLSSVKELKHIESLCQLTDGCKGFVPFLYSYRSITQAIGADLPEDLIGGDFNLYQKTVSAGTNEKEQFAPVAEEFNKFFEGPFQRISQFVDFLKDLPKQISRIFLDLSNESIVPSDVFYMKLTNLFDVMYNLDELKLVKTGLVADVRFFKSCKGDLKNDAELNLRFQVVQMTLPMSHITLSDLRSALEGFAKQKAKDMFIPILGGYLDYAVKTYRNQVLMPTDRNALMIGILSVLHFSGGNTTTMTSVSTLSSAEAARQILADNPIVSLYAECAVRPGDILSKVPGLNVSGIPYEENQLRKIQDKFLVQKRMAEFREMYQRVFPVTVQWEQTGKVELDDLKLVLQSLSQMSMAIRTQFSFKMLVLPEKKTDDQGKNLKNYDRGIRYNYTAEDLNALIELIGYVKALSCTVIQVEDVIISSMSKLVNQELQVFGQQIFGELLARAQKAKDSVVGEALKNAQDLLTAFTGIPAISAPSGKGGKSSSVATRDTQASVSVHQIDVFRVELHNFIRAGTIFTKKQKGMFGGGPIVEKGLVSQIQSFLDKSYLWYLLLDPISLIREGTNLSSLWFREVYLQLDHTIQFPVRSSLPFILIEHLLQSLEHPELHDSMMFPFEIYNDCAYAALNTFRSQYLYREVEAEVSLSIDMIAFTFSETIFKCFREAAAAIESPAEYAGKIVPAIMRYNIMVGQNKLQLLGSAVDFNLVATTKLNQKIRKELESYIELITDFRLIPYVAHLVRVIRTTHSLLIQNNLRMDDFDAIWQRAKGFTNPLALESNFVNRIVPTFDFPRWLYNADSRRFTSSKPLAISAQTTEQWEKAYAIMHQRDAHYIGTDHIRALIELLSAGEISYLVQQLKLRFETDMVKLVDVYASVAPALRVTTAHSKDELIGYFNFNTDAYSELFVPTLGQMFNLMRNIGNTIACLQLLEEYLPNGSDGKSLLESFLTLTKSMLKEKKELFSQGSGFEICNSTTHTSFTSRWCVLEVLMCMSRKVKISDTQIVQPLEVFGDGPAYAAQLFITLLGQESLYRFDSMLRRIVALQYVEAAKIASMKDLSEFLKHAQGLISAMNAADRIASPYK